VTVLIIAIMIAATAAAIVLPFLRPTAPAGSGQSGGNERYEREKNVALLAIREADFDLATGKLSREDHESLRDIYERRAHDAISALETPAAAVSRRGDARPAAFCSACGAAFHGTDRFCSGCGARRVELVTSD
jgi:hypothetical protein